MEEKTKCDYPGCRGDANGSINLILSNEKSASVDLPMCEYHKLILMGGRFTAKVVKTPAFGPTEKNPEGTPAKTEFEIEGPLLEVEMAEQVFAAIETNRANLKKK